VDQSFVRAAHLIARCSGRLAVMGIGKSGLVGRKLSATFASTGTPSIFIHPTEGLHGDMGMLTKGDVVLALSYSGETEELKKVLRLIGLMGIPLVALTGRIRSALGESAAVVLNAAVRREACPYNVAPTASTTAMLALGDALALAVMRLKGFKKEDFARIHPGGMLGKRLTLRVGDIMHTGRENPIVQTTQKVRAALLVMTKTRWGSASVVDARGKLVGVFTDGDLRRRLQKDPGLLDKSVGDVMTLRPQTVGPDQLASDVAGLLKKIRVDNFPVVDPRGRPIGIIDEKDLLEEGLA